MDAKNRGKKYVGEIGWKIGISNMWGKQDGKIEPKNRWDIRRRIRIEKIVGDNKCKK